MRQEAQRARGQQHSGSVALGGNQYLSYCFTHLGHGRWHGWYQLPGEKTFKRWGTRRNIVRHLRQMASWLREEGV